MKTKLLGLMLACAGIAPLLLGCGSQSVWESSDAFSPINLSAGMATSRLILTSGSPAGFDVDYSWVGPSGTCVTSESVVNELNRFTNFDRDSDLVRALPEDSLWYWNPGFRADNLDQGSRGKIISRADTIIILSVRPTIALRIFRPTVYRAFNSVAPGGDIYWSWSRIVLRDGFADGCLVPSDELDVGQVLFPSANAVLPIDLSDEGDCDVGEYVLRWRKVNVEGGMSSYLFSFSE